MNQLLFDNLILQSDTCWVKAAGTRQKKVKQPDPNWQKTNHTGLVRYVPSGIYFARLRVGGKLIRQTLHTDVLTVAKLRLDELAKEERKRLETVSETAKGNVTFGELLKILLDRRQADTSLKRRTREYDGQRAKALYKSWPELEGTEVRRLSKSDCLTWAAKFAAAYSANSFNHTQAMLRHALEIAVEMGARYDNPARFIKRKSEKSKRMTLPEPKQFEELVAVMRQAGGRDSVNCADLVEFMAYGGFRKSEAANVQWKHCNFHKGIIEVHGDAEEGTKNGEARNVPMIADMSRLLKRLKQERPQSKPDEAVMLVKECQKSLDRAVAMVGVPRITHHDLRHLFATRCIEAGVDIPTVSRWLGHKDGGAMAMRVYGHLRDDYSMEMARKVSFHSASVVT